MSCEGWRNFKLEDILEVSSSKRIYAKEYSNSGIPFYRSKEIIEKHNGNEPGTKLFISINRYSELKQKFGAPSKGDILLTSVGTLGIPYLVQNEKFYFKDGNLTWLRNFKNECLNKFIYYWLQSDYGRNQITSKCIGSTQKALTIDTIKKFDILLPSLEEQKFISYFLSILDKRIEVNNKINHNIETMAQAIFKHWFVDFEFPDENGKPYKSSGGEMIESELGMIPKGWKFRTLGELIELFDSKRIPLSKKERACRKKIYPYYGAASRMDFVDDYLFDGIYILLGEDGTVIDEKGYPILQYVWGKFWVNNHAHVLKGKFGISQDFLLVLLKNLKVQSIVTGAVQPKINQQNLRNLQVLLPMSNAIILKYSKMIQANFDLWRKNSDENQRLTRIRDTLLPKLMSGEIRVPVEKQ